MEKELYHIDEVKHALRKINPHIELKEYRKNHSNFTLDLILTLSGHQAKVEVPMDLFRDYGPGDKEQIEELLQQGYVQLLRKLEEK